MVAGEERGGKRGGGEGEKIEGDEKEFVEGADGEEDVLGTVASALYIPHKFVRERVHTLLL